MQVSALNQVLEQIQHIDPNQFPFSVFSSTTHHSQGYDELRNLRQNGVRCYPQRAPFLFQPESLCQFTHALHRICMRKIRTIFRDDRGQSI